MAAETWIWAKKNNLKNSFSARRSYFFEVGSFFKSRIFFTIFSINIKFREKNILIFFLADFGADPGVLGNISERDFGEFLAKTRFLLRTKGARVDGKGAAEIVVD